MGNQRLSKLHVARSPAISCCHVVDSCVLLTVRNLAIDTSRVTYDALHQRTISPSKSSLVNFMFGTGIEGN